MVASVISSCIDDLASVIVGLSMDFTAVGYFSVALRILRAAIIVVMTPLQLVMMPALSRIAHAKDQFGAAYTDMVVLTAMIWLPLVAGLGLAAPTLIPLVFGAQWTGSVPVVEAMCFVGLTMPLWTFSGQALSALGRPDVFARDGRIGSSASTVSRSRWPCTVRRGGGRLDLGGACRPLMVPVSLRLPAPSVGVRSEADCWPAAPAHRRLPVRAMVATMALYGRGARCRSGVWPLALAGLGGVRDRCLLGTMECRGVAGPC